MVSGNFREHVPAIVAARERQQAVKAYNLAELQNIEREFHEPGIQAVAELLTNIKPYIDGNKALSEKTISEIKSKTKSIKQKVEEQARKTIAVQLEGKETMFRKLERVNNWQDFIQVLACDAAYYAWKENDPISCQFANYRVDTVITNKKGLQIVLFTPVEVGMGPPIFSCRGTTENLQNALDDLGKHIGQRGFKQSEYELEEKLSDTVETYGSAVICGHSLGGALAQAITARFCDRESPTNKPWLNRCIFFNAPGCGKKIAQEYKDKKTKLKTAPEVIGYRHEKDIVSLTGGPHLETREKIQVGEFDSSTNPLKAHTLIHFVSLYKKVKINITPSSAHRFLMGIAENLRASVRKIGKVFIKIFFLKPQKELSKRIEQITTWIKPSQFTAMDKTMTHRMKINLQKLESILSTHRGAGMRAVLKVLENLDPYLKGEKLLTSKQFKAIEAEIIRMGWHAQ